MKKYTPLVLILAFFILMGVCVRALVIDESPVHDNIVLLRKGEARKSTVWKTGAYCSAGWFRSIDNFLLRRDGTAVDGVFNYKWTLHEWGNDQDRKWFDANCKEPPQ